MQSSVDPLQDPIPSWNPNRTPNLSNKNPNPPQCLRPSGGWNQVHLPVYERVLDLNPDPVLNLNYDQIWVFHPQVNLSLLSTANFRSRII